MSEIGRPTGPGAIRWVLVLAASLVAMAGCRHSVPVEPGKLGELSDYREADGVEVVDSTGETVEVTEENDPVVEMATTRECSFGEVLASVFFTTCESSLVFELANLEVDGETMTVDRSATTSGDSTTLTADEIREVRLALDDYIPSDFGPDYALGAEAGGPLGLVGFHAHYFALPQIVVDGGVTALPGIAAAFAGTRLRPVRLGPVRPFVGGLVSGYAGFGAGEDGGGGSVAYGAWGTRAGLDIEFGNRKGLLGVEFNLMNTFDDRGFLGRESGDWVPWGGVYVARQF